MNNFCLYKHIRLDIDQVFYIGIGNSKRPFSKKDRNRYWKNIVNKTDYKIEIFKSDLTWKEACQLEIELIKEYGRVDNKTGILCNLTNGGEGATGFVCTEKMRQTRAKYLLSDNLGIKKSEKHRENMKLHSGKAKKIICTDTGKIWNSIVDCASENNLKMITLSQYLRGTRKNKTTFKFLSYESV